MADSEFSPLKESQLSGKPPRIRISRSSFHGHAIHFRDNFREGIVLPKAGLEL